MLEGAGRGGEDGMSRKDPPKINHPYIFSISQAETFVLCPRKWAYLKIDGIEDPGNESSRLGGEVHDILEKYLEKGIPVPPSRAGRIAMSALPHLPPPRFPGMKIEEWFHVKIGSYQGKHGVGAYYRGLKDVEIPRGWRNNRPFVSDHKTTKNFMWAKSADDLTGGVSGLGNFQAGVYSYATMLDTHRTEVDLQWTYMRTTGPPVSEPTIALINEDQVGRIIEHLETVTEDMIRTRDEHESAATVPQNPKGCNAFGGCPFRSKCNLEPSEIFEAIMNQVAAENSVLKRLQERKAAKAGKTSSSASTPAPTAPAEATSEASPEVTESAQKAASSAPEQTSQQPTLAPVETTQAAAINPPEGEYSPEPSAEEKSGGKKTKGKGKGSTAAASTAAPVASPSCCGQGKSTGAFARAISAFWDVLADDIASRIAEKIQK